MKRTSTRFATAFMAGALALSGGAMLPAIATAQVTPGAGQTSTVDLDAPVNLTIEKYEGDPTGIPGDPGGLPTVSGVQFVIEQVQLTNPLNTAAGWEEVSGLTAENPPLGGFSATVTTGADGTVTLSSGENPGFGVGVYRVREIQQGQFSVADPFLVSLPFTTADSGWGYDQTVQPKNQQLSLDVDVADEAVTLGETLRYTVSAVVPGGNLTRFIIEDQLADEVTYANGLTVTAEGVTLVEGTDYTVTVVDGLVRVEFTPAGRAAIQAARATNPGLTVDVAFDATVSALPATGVISNDATLYLPNGGVVTTDPTLPGGPDPDAPSYGVTTRISTLQITKTGEGFGNDDPQTMEGAAFELWRCTEQDELWALIGDAPLNAATTAEGTANGTTTFVTPGGDADNTSTVTLFGVQAFDWVDSAPVDENYCVVETEAPEGFSLNPEPQPVIFENETNPAAANYRMVAEVTNQRDSILGQLPMTGGRGVYMILFAGLLLIGGGIWAAVRSNRRTV